MVTQRYYTIFTIMFLSFVALITSGFASSDNKPILTASQSSGYVKLEWAVEMLEEDILYKTGFEEGDVLPNLNYSSSETYLPENRWYGGQTFTTKSSYSGKRSLEIKNTYKNSNLYNFDLDGNVKVNESVTWADFRDARYYMENGTDLSLSFRMKTTGIGEVNFGGEGGTADYGRPLEATFLEDVNVGEKTVKVSDVSFFKKYVDEGRRLHLATRKGRYAYAYVEEVDTKKSTITLSQGFTGEFKKGDNV